MLKIEFLSYVPEDLDYFDSGWSKDCIYCTANITDSEVKELVNWHRFQCNDVQKIKEIKVSEGEPKMFAHIYSKGESLMYTDRSGKLRLKNTWNYKCYMPVAIPL